MINSFFLKTSAFWSIYKIRKISSFGWIRKHLKIFCKLDGVKKILKKNSFKFQLSEKAFVIEVKSALNSGTIENFGRTTGTTLLGR